MNAANVPFQTLNQKLEMDNDLGYGQLFAVLLRRKFWVLIPFFLSLIAAVVHSSRQEPEYVSSMQFLVQSNYRSTTKSPDATFVDPEVQVDIAGQIVVMQSTDLIRRAMFVIQEQYPGLYPEINPQDPRAFYAFKQAIEIGQVSPDPKKASPTNIFQVEYTSNDDIKTQRVLQALQQVYQDYNLEQQKKRLEEGLAFINEQIPGAKQQVAQAESSLETFRKSKGLIDPEQQAQAQVAILNTLDQELRANESLMREMNSRYASLVQQIGLGPEQAVLAARLSQSTRYQGLLNQIQETELGLVQQRLRFTELTPQVQQLNEQRQNQLQLLAGEIGRALNVDVSDTSPEALLFQGQLSASDVNLVNEMLTAKINLDSSVARQQGLLRSRQLIQAELSRYPELLAEYGRLLPAIVTSRETLQLLLTAQQELGLDIARGAFDWQVVEEPLRGYPLGPTLSKNLLLGAVAGLMLGGMAAFGREALDDMVHTSDDLQKQVPVPLLGMVPVIRVEGADFGRNSRDEIDDNEEALAPAMQSILRWHGFREAMDLVYQNIHLVNTTGAIKSLVVTSALAGEGKSTLAVGLAFSAARLHRRVLLIDGDLRRPSLHNLMNLPNREGLSTVLKEGGEIPPHLLPLAEEAGRTGVSVLTAGPASADAPKLLSSRRMKELIQTFEDHYDLVIIDAPPSSGMVDAMLMASQCDGVLMVGRMDRLTKTELTQSLENLRHLNVIGVVANGVSQIRQQYAYVVNDDDN